MGQALLAAALNVPVSVMKTAGEGGPWGMAILAMYYLSGAKESLPDYLDGKVFAGSEATTLEPDPEDVSGFNAFIESYKACLPAEKAAIESL